MRNLNGQPFSLCLSSKILLKLRLARRLEWCRGRQTVEVKGSRGLCPRNASRVTRARGGCASRKISFKNSSAKRNIFAEKKEILPARAIFFQKMKRQGRKFFVNKRKNKKTKKEKTA